MPRKHAFEHTVWAAPQWGGPDGEALDLARYRIPALADRARGGLGCTVASAVRSTEHGQPLDVYAREGAELVRAFSAGLVLADLELRPDAPTPRILFRVSYSTRTPHDTPTPHASLLLLAHVRLAD
jgi:hypothetical protein